MRLSDAILAGSSVVKAVAGTGCEMNEDSGCALTMAGIAGGLQRPEDCFDVLNTVWTRTSQLWPWLEDYAKRKCPAASCHHFEDPSWVNRGPTYMAVIAHAFDAHVMGQYGDGSRITLEQLVDYVRSIEPAEEPEAYQGDAGDETEPKCSVCSEPLYLHNEPCESEDYDPAMVSRERERGLSR